MLKFYGYKNCSTCRDAMAWLKQHDIPFEELAIRETPPSVHELRAMLDALGGEIRRLFNTSGMDYRALGLKDKLPTLSTEDALKLLHSNGNLIKRPFLIDEASKRFFVGFKAEAWKHLSK